MQLVCHAGRATTVSELCMNGLQVQVGGIPWCWEAVSGDPVPPGLESGSPVTSGGWEGRKIDSSVASAPHHVSDTDTALLKQNKW